MKRQILLLLLLMPVCYADDPIPLPGNVPDDRIIISPPVQEIIIDPIQPENINIEIDQPNLPQNNINITSINPQNNTINLNISLNSSDPLTGRVIRVNNTVSGGNSSWRLSAKVNISNVSYEGYDQNAHIIKPFSGRFDEKSGRFVSSSDPNPDIKENTDEKQYSEQAMEAEEVSRGIPFIRSIVNFFRKYFG